MNELALFAGAGGGILGGVLLGWRTVAAVEIEAYPRAVLLQRQADGILPRFPVWDDVRTFEGKPWSGRVDVISGGFPCQDISVAGKGVGIDGKRSGLWKEFARIIGEVRPKYIFVENSPALVRRGLAVVLGDLAELGYDATWCVLGADDAGAPHRRKRIWIKGELGNSRSERRNAGRNHNGENERTESGATDQYASNLANTKSQRCGETREFRYDESTERIAGGGEDVADPQSKCRRRGFCETESIGNGVELANSGCSVSNANQLDVDGGGYGAGEISQQQSACVSGVFSNSDGKRGCGGASGVEDAENAWESSGGEGRLLWWESEPELGRVAHGVAHRVDRLKAIGNGQVPAVAALAWENLSNRCGAPL
jgi:DNA (cytosine-5)-methyltransferase 1